MEVEGPKSNASWILVNLECSGYYRQVYISSYFLNFFIILISFSFLQKKVLTTTNEIGNYFQINF